MTYHILNGDSLAGTFPEAKLPGEIVVMREGLIDGPLAGNKLRDLWETRARYMHISGDAYHKSIVTEFEKILHASNGAEFNCWFEYDLFCQVNLWFVLTLIHDLPVKKKVFTVYASHLNRNSNHFWNGFGRADAQDLLACFNNRILLDEEDLHLARELWQAYRINDLEELAHLAKYQSPAFPYLKEVIRAHIDRFPHDGEKGRPEKVVEDIIKSGSTDFPKVFAEFWKRESIYGFGDVQLKKIYDEVVR